MPSVMERDSLSDLRHHGAVLLLGIDAVVAERFGENLAVLDVDGFVGKLFAAFCAVFCDHFGCVLVLVLVFKSDLIAQLVVFGNFEVPFASPLW